MAVLRLLLWLIVVASIIWCPARGHQLGSRCHNNEDCTLEMSGGVMCDEGRCECLPHHVPLNRSTCIQVPISASLLGFDCLLDSQCKDRVENSSCVNGSCRCDAGFIPFKRHACLPPAKLDQICYSEEQCRLWDSDSTCDYIIPNVIGRCHCTPASRQLGVQCLPRTANNNNNNDIVEVETVDTSSLIVTTPVSLGLRCISDSQCLSSDPNSRCLNGICDCKSNNGSAVPHCSALNTGCYPGTFQCRATGQCISWFFVCDGRAHCADGSDEDGCNGPQCPPLSFKCKSGGCVSRASLCDGVNDCKGGEDEMGCHGQKTCPSFTLKCRGVDTKCLPEYELCNAVKGCADGSDELRSVCRGKRGRGIPGVTNTANCPFRCANGRCRSSAVVCSGRDGCGDNSDEDQCAICKCPTS
ncbi:sortilin-related receptor-like isoform X2 [Neocloeon triangulifer]|uniref:sortilin-related receptor-like isoform X2 n=1 Tax=Neocloeon triangulifer TaxID=2078957 RepID=UPI00286EC1A6|nr:sortilin-related receptor-like isoform X2 [Neocloeon triangulifer]